MSTGADKDKQMKLSDFEMVRTLGSGSFGRVKYAKSKLDGKFYAVKYMKKHDIIKMKQGTYKLYRVQLKLSQSNT
jgi:serine/threonine protein kinase